MRKKLVRTLTFVFGLYFILEFLLPKEIGGNFDKSGFQTPTVCYDSASGEYRLYYVGVYGRREQRVGIATSKDGVHWQKYAGNPVLRPTLLNSSDRLGFSSVSPIKTKDGYALYYLGHDMDTPPHPTICWATGDDGLHWKKKGRLKFDGPTPWRQQDEDDLSIVKRPVRYAKLQAITAAMVDGSPTLFIAQTNAEGRTEVVRAKPTGTDATWAVDPNPLPLTGIKKTQKAISLSYIEKDGAAELWLALSDKGMCRARFGDEMAVERVFGPAVAEEETKEVVAAVVVETPFFQKLYAAARAALEVRPPDKDFFQKLYASARAACVLHKPDPYDKIHDMTVFATADGYRLVFSRESGDKTPEDEVEPTVLYTISSADGTTWPTPRIDDERTFFKRLYAASMRAGEANGRRGLAPLFTKGAPAQPTYLSRGYEFMSTFLMVIGAFAIGLGGVNMGIMHGRRIVKGGAGVHNSAIFFICLIVMFVAALFGKPLMDKIKEAEATAITVMDVRDKTADIKDEYPYFRFALAKVFNFLLYNLSLNLGTTLFALVSFYMVGAAFRSFRAKSLESGLLIVAATIVLLGQIPLGAQMGSWAPQASGKLLIVFNAAAFRGVVLGMAVAAISTSVRLWLGLEKGMFHGT